MKRSRGMSLLSISPLLVLGATLQCRAFAPDDPPTPADTLRYVSRFDVKPDIAHEVIPVETAGKIRTYFLLNPHRVARISVKGPGDLRVLTRVQFTSREQAELDYRLSYCLNGGEERTFVAEGVQRSEEAIYKVPSLGIPGETKDIRIRVGRGFHSLEFTLQDSSAKVAARFVFVPGNHEKVKWIPLMPASPVEPVDLVEFEEIAHYYRFSSERPLTIDIIGPTEVRLTSRLENTYKMNGQINYRLQVKQDGEVLRTYQLSSKRSATVRYKNSPKLVPGKAREIAFKVPQGKHKYEMVMLEKGTILGQMVFPEKDARLEE